MSKIPLVRVLLRPDAAYNVELYEHLGVGWTPEAIQRYCEFYITFWTTEPGDAKARAAQAVQRCQEILEDYARQLVQSHQLVRVAYTLRDDWKCKERHDLGLQRNEHGHCCSGVCSLAGIDARGTVYHYNPESWR